MTTTTTRRVQILVFDDAEVLDVAGPFEVFAVSGRRHGLSPFAVELVGSRPGPITLRNGLVVAPPVSLETAGPADILVVPGGPGSRRELGNQPLLDWIRTRAGAAELVLSVCTGALLLGKIGLLDGLEATTHHGAYEELRSVAPRALVRDGERFLDNGRVVASGGVSAGIDMSLHVVERLLGTELAEEAAAYMEYHWDRNEEGLRDLGV